MCPFLSWKGMGQLYSHDDLECNPSANGELPVICISQSQNNHQHKYMQKTLPFFRLFFKNLLISISSQMQGGEFIYTCAIFMCSQ